MTRLLVVDDDDDVRHAISRALEKQASGMFMAATAREALAIATQATVDVVVLDLGLPDADGVAVLTALLGVDPSCRVVVLTGRDDARAAVGALRAGAADYLVKPFEREELLRAVARAGEESALRREVQQARQAIQDRGLVGASPAWTRVLDELHLLAERSRASVLITGESGTGKELVARLLHASSPRSAGPFVTVNAACLPAQILESELFGHEAGAFTDARSSRQGLFELAHRGTLFLDEIGEFPLELQPKLLRVLEGHPFRRVGGQRELLTDVRVVSATNRDLQAMVAAGTFREDLYFRLGVFQLSLPPLRHRTGDVRRLVVHWIAALGAEMGLRATTIAPRAVAQLELYGWPGNVRELRNVIERALVLARGGVIDIEHLPPEIGATAPAPLAPSAADVAPLPPAAVAPAADTTLSLEGAVRRHILAVYAAHSGNVTRTAGALGITRVCLRRHLRLYLTDQERTAAST
ncbi:sigma-54 dependent transcriptional regulator [Sorangium sp. So ce726]|uniref:sigma-54-dependent transcriptional regulator n=1 Tax=Sorangium sp. So ce726 TaxID=3133319 RepID=UPI003F6479E0